ncbi:MAG: type I phosphomannose isomerase catalytic subunit [Myxococcota bacterium]
MWDKVGAKNWRRPLLLQADNFTPAARTPWGGRRLADGLKRASGVAPGRVVGEAWEFSVEPDFPSGVEGGRLLDQVIRADPDAWLGRDVGEGSTALLVKLLDAADDLSVQIHPTDDDAALADDESGKPEAWYILDATEGSGLYLGFRRGVEREDVERAIASERDVSELMHFVPVSTGNAFVIEPGTPHAVGSGVLLLEPQRVAPSKRGITYRYWDWNRRYDPEGRLDPNGKPRELHLQRALDVTRWSGPREAELLASIRRDLGAPDVAGVAKLEAMIGLDGPLRSRTFDIRRVAGTGEIDLPDATSIRSLTVLGGTLAIRHEAGQLEIPEGRTAALPACLSSVGLELAEAHAVLCELV